jgi:hypothetical protein
MGTMSYYKLKNSATIEDSFNDAVMDLLQNMGGKTENAVSLGSDWGMIGDTNQLHASLATGQYKENE